MGLLITPLDSAFTLAVRTRDYDDCTRLLLSSNVTNNALDIPSLYAEKKSYSTLIAQDDSITVQSDHDVVVARPKIGVPPLTRPTLLQ